MQETRDEEDRTARRLAAAIFLSTQTRMSIYRTSMQRDAEANNLLRRFERARAHRERYVDVVSAASELRRHFKAVSAQLRGSNRLLIPLTRHTQAHREAKRCASVLQSVVRVWLLNYHGQSSSVEMYGDRRFVIGEAREEPEEPEDPVSAPPRQRSPSQSPAFATTRCARPRRPSQCPPPDDALLSSTDPFFCCRTRERSAGSTSTWTRSGGPPSRSSEGRGWLLPSRVRPA